MIVVVSGRNTPVAIARQAPIMHRAFVKAFMLLVALNVTDFASCSVLSVSSASPLESHFGKARKVYILLCLNI